MLFQGSLDRIFKSLPNVDQATKIVLITFTLSGYMDDDVSCSKFL